MSRLINVEPSISIFDIIIFRNNMRTRSKPLHITGVYNPADLFTKSLPVIKVEQFRSKIGLSWNSSV